MNHNHGRVIRGACDCGRPATIVLNGYRICQHCYELDKRHAGKEKTLPEDWELLFQRRHADVDIACTRWLKKKGLWNPRGFGRIYNGSQSGVKALLARL